MADIDVIERAMIKIGEPSITNYRQSPNGTAWGIVYEDKRKALLSSNFWRFAITRAVLAPVDEELYTNQFNYAFELPSDCLLLMQAGEFYKRPNVSDNIVSSDENYSVEGSRILSKSGNKIYIKYIRDVTDDSKWSRMFYEALISWIAAEMCPKTKQGVQMRESLNREFERFEAKAVENNEVQKDTETLPDNSWVSAREGIGHAY